MKKSAQVHQGFTLVELLVVIAIIAILAAVVVLIINPLELTRRGRDAARLTDLSNLQNALNVAVQEATGSGAEGILCIGDPDKKFPCEGRSNTGTRVSDGSGWVKADLSSQKSVSVPTLPIDPISPNDANNHYTYCAAGDAWEIDTVLESDQQKPKMVNDGGEDNTKYEVGSNLGLIKTAGGSCTY